MTVLETIAAFGVSSGVARSSVIYALVSASHILGMALLIGPILLVDLHLIGVVRRLDSAAIALLRWVAKIGVTLTILAGLMLFSAKPAEYAINPVFWAKMLVVVAGLTNALVLEWRLRRGSDQTLSTGAAPVVGVTSLTAWLIALLLGRWIAFSG
ncbi:MAG: DUF6644 family protein [Beijerinckiaceae bacterium]